MGKPTDDQNRSYYVLVTAGHVLDDIAGDTATLMLRENRDDGGYTEKPWNITIRDRGEKNLYVKLSDVDVAALYVNMPDTLNIAIVPASLLGTDDVFIKYEIHPGDELRCLGYPLGVSSPAGFPILRSGAIASYPIVPTDINKAFYFDFRVFPANSGGPVYFVDHDRVYGGSIHLGETIQFLAGLVTSQLSSRIYNNQFVEVAQVVPASYILKTIALLPVSSPYK